MQFKSNLYIIVMMNKPKTILVESDYHSGHRAGLTGPMYRRTDWKEREHELYSFYVIQKEVYNWRKKILKEIGDIDIHFILGDTIDGRGERSGGTEIIEPEVTSQIVMASELIEEAGAKERIMVRGTPYHVGGKDGDYENAIAHNVGATIGNHLFVDVNGCIFDLKHKIGGSQSPVGVATSLEKSRVHNVLWSVESGQEQPRSNVILRGHTHVFRAVMTADTLSVKCPAISGFGSKYGEKECESIVQIGLLIIKVDSKGGYTWQPRILRGEFLKAPVLKL